MNPEYLVQQLKSSKEFLDRATRELTEKESNFAPSPDTFTAAQLIAHIGLSATWFVEGAFGSGFVMTESAMADEFKGITSLKEARAICTKNYNIAIELIASKTMEELLEPLPEGPVMAGLPKLAIVEGIIEHTAHHRGALSVYTRLCGKVPPMPYIDC